MKLPIGLGLALVFAAASPAEEITEARLLYATIDYLKGAGAGAQ